MSTDPASKSSNVSIFELALVPVVLVIFSQIVPYQFDTWWALALGEDALATGSLPFHETFSYTARGNDLHNHSWLSQVVFAWLHAFALVPAFLCATAVGIALLVFGCARSLGASPLLAFLFTGISLGMSGTLYAARPQIFTFLFVAALYFDFLSKRRTHRLPGLWLSLLFPVWSNLHGGYVLGILMLLALSLYHFIVQRFHPDNYSLALAKRYLWLFVLFIVLSFLHPLGVFQFANVIKHDPLALDASKMISEWQSPTLSSTPFFYFSFALSGLLLILPFQKTQLEIFILFSVSVFAYSAERHVPFMAICGLPVLAAWTTRALEKVGSFRAGVLLLSKDFIPFSRQCVIPLCLGVSVLVVVLTRGDESTRGDIPVDLVSQLQQMEPRPKRLFHPYGWGGYLGYHLRPQTQIFLDGRFWPFIDVIPDYVTLYQGQPGWEELVQSYDIDSALLPIQSQLAQKLAQSALWQPIAEDGNAALYLRREYVTSW